MYDQMCNILHSRDILHDVDVFLFFSHLSNKSDNMTCVTNKNSQKGLFRMAINHKPFVFTSTVPKCMECLRATLQNRALKARTSLLKVSPIDTKDTLQI